MKMFVFLMIGMGIIFLAGALVSATTDGMIVYRGGGDSSIPEYRIYNDTNWNSEGTALDVTGALNYVKVITNPDSNSNEKILCTEDSANDINCQVWNGASWGNLNEFSLNGGGGRSFDLVYINNSHALVCYREPTDTSIPYCDIWDGSSWTGNDAGDVSGAINTLRLIDDPNSNYSALMTKSADEDINVQIFNGSSWGNLLEVETSTTTCNPCLSYDGAWTSFGEFMAVWFSADDDEIESIKFSKSSGWQTQNDSVITGMTGTDNQIDLVSNPDPSNEELLLVSATDEDFLITNFWNGTSWGINQTITTSIGGTITATSRPFSLVYEQSGDYEAVLTFGITATNISWVIWNSSDSWESINTFSSLDEDIDWMQLAPNLNNENIMLTTLGITNDVDSIEWNGSAWDSSWFEQETSSNDAQWNSWFTYGGKVLGTASNILNITAFPTIIKGGEVITIYANTTSNGVNDSDGDTLYLYCNNSTTPTVVNTDCTGGTTIDSTYPYELTCTFATTQDDLNYTEYCRIYDGTFYSDVVNATYTTDSTPPSTSVLSVAGDTAASYFDTNNDGITEINVSGESEMSCRWSNSDLAYLGMSNDCTISGSTATCNVNDVSSQGFHTRYVACQDFLGNEQNATQNLHVQFYLDYTAPMTSDNSVTTIKVPNYTVTMAEVDNVDSNPDTLYCVDTSDSCSPSITIDHGGAVIFTSANRGRNYLRYYSTDDAGNQQTTISKTININQFPVFSSATDNSTTIGPGWIVNITTVSSDADSGQDLTLYVCNSSLVNSSGCLDGVYCSATSTGNLSCTFIAESSSGTYNWYAFIYDELNEGATSNYSGTYDVDSDAPVITINSPQNTTYTQPSVSASITLNEAGNSARYSLDGAANVTISNSSPVDWSSTLTNLNGSHNITFYANDSYGNMKVSSIVFFYVNLTGIDLTSPTLTVWSPANNTYYSYSNILLNITGDENLFWGGYSDNEGALTTLDNVSPTNWNATVAFSEGGHNINFYANDTSNNTGSNGVTIYVDLTEPIVETFSCSPNPANDSEDVNCSVRASDNLLLDYVIISHNATGTFQNSSQLSLSGNNDTASYLIGNGNTSVGNFRVSVYAYDSSGRVNSTVFTMVSVLDDTSPRVDNISYSPNTTDDLDPGVEVEVNATIVEDYNISVVYLMYRNSSSDWTYVQMNNNSALVVGSESTIFYNASFTPQNGTWIFRVNATDNAENQNVSTNTTIVVENDLSFTNSTNIPSVKSITYADRADNNSMGWIFVNNTGDVALNFSFNVSSDIRNRFDINGSDSANVTYEVAAGSSINISVYVNTTELSATTYDYNVSLESDAGSTIFEKQLNVQSAAGAYLVLSIDTYSSRVNPGDTNVSYSATVYNLGTADATDVFLSWNLPSGFSLIAGSLSRSLGTMPISDSGTNAITISVDSDAGISNVGVVALANSSNTDSVNSTKTVDIVSAVVEEPAQPAVVSVGGGGGGYSASAGGSLASNLFTETIEVVRGDDGLSFEIAVKPNYANTTLDNLTLEVTGFLEQYVEIFPKVISSIDYGETEKFTVVINAPSYKGYEEHELIAKVKGKLVRGNKISSYVEKHTINLVIQEVSFEETKEVLKTAQEHVELMKSKGFNVDFVVGLLFEAEKRLEKRINSEAHDLAREVIEIKEKSFYVNDFIRGLVEIEKNPGKTHHLSGDVIKAVEEEERTLFNFLTGRLFMTGKVVGEGVRETGNSEEVEQVPLRSLISGNAVFSSEGVRELLNLAIVAFDRGDYELANERAKEAQSMLLLKRKGNLGLFFYLYWHLVSIAMVIFLFSGIFANRKYQKSVLIRNIGDNENQEKNVQDIMIKSQRDYFDGKISPEYYKQTMKNSKKKLANLKEDRQMLRKKRWKRLKSKELLKSLENERGEIENRIKKLQADYYVEQKISQDEYDFQFEMLSERLAEVEEESTAINLEKEKKVIGREEKDFGIGHVRKKNFFDKLKNKFNRRNLR